MSGEIKLDIAADTRGAVRGVDNLGAALDDVVDDLEELNRTGDVIEAALVKNFREIARQADRAGKDTKDGLSDGLKGAAKEAEQSGKEAAQSFSGGFDDVADFMQETLAQAFGGFGPLGAAAGVALAAALGAALAGAADAQEKLEEARSRASDLAQTLYDNKGKLPMEDAIQRVLELLPSERGAGNPLESFINDWVDLGTNIDAVKRAAKGADTPVQTFIRGLSGADIGSTRDALDAVNEALEKLQEKASKELNLDNGVAKSQLESLKSQLEGVLTTSELADDALSYVGSSFDSQAYRDQVAAIGTAWQDAMVDAGAYIDEQDGVTTFDWSAYLADAESTLAAANEYKRKIVTLPPDVKGEAERIFTEQGAKAANSYVSAYEGASAADKARFTSAARQNGEAAGKAQGESFAREAEAAAKSKAQGWGPLTMPVKPQIDDSNIRNYRPPVVYIPGRIVDQHGRQIV